MPSKTRSKKNAAPSSGGEQKHDEGYTSKEPKLQLIQLDGYNYDEWIKRLQHVFYAKDWLAVYTASEDADATKKASEEAFDDTDRRRAWGVITCSLQQDMANQVNHIALGEVEQLLRAIKSYFYRDTVKSRSKLRKELQQAQLEDHSNVNVYIAYVRDLISKLDKMGHKVDDADAIEYLLDGLPSDYDVVKRVLRMPRTTPLTWKETAFQIEDFADDPAVAGSSRPSPTPDTVLTTEEICRTYARTGKCKFKNRCRFKHIDKPSGNRFKGKCNYCGIKGHKEAQCYKKKRELNAKSKEKEEDSSNAAEDAGDESYPVEDSCTDDVDVVSTNIDTAYKTGTIPFLIDGGSTCHVCTDRSLFTNMRPCNIKVKVGGGVVICKEKGDISPQVQTPSGNWLTLNLRDARYIPSFGTNIISERKILAKQRKIVKEDNTLKVLRQNDDIIFEVKGSPLFVLHAYLPACSDSSSSSEETLNSDENKKEQIVAKARFVPKNTDIPPTNFHTVESREGSESEIARFDSLRIKSSNCCSKDYILLSDDLSSWKFAVALQDARYSYDECDSAHPARSYGNNSSKLQLWHQRLGHRNFRDVARLTDQQLPSKPCLCRTCIEGKSQRHRLAERNLPLHQAPRPGYLFHCDVHGPFRCSTNGGATYLHVVVDDYSRFIFLFLSKSSRFFELFSEHVKRVESQFGHERVVAQLKSDSATYYEKSAQLQEFCRKKGIVQLFSPPYTQELNGVAERCIRTVLEMTRCMLIHAGAPPSLRGEALMYAAVILNRLPWKQNATRTRLERWEGRQQPDAHLVIRVWGCEAWIHRDHGARAPKLDSFEAKAASGYCLVGYDPARKCYRLTKKPNYRSITFSAHVTFDEASFPMKQHTQRPSRTHITASNMTDITASNMTANARPTREWHPTAAALENIVTESDKQQASVYFADEVWATAAGEPQDYKAAMKLPDAALWRNAITREYKSHQENKTFSRPLDSSEIPEGTVVIPAGDVFKLKRDGRRKYRVVIRGYHMQQGQHFNDTFAPTPHIPILRALFAMAAKFDWEIKQGDVPTAFLIPEIDCKLFISLPSYFSADPSTAVPDTGKRTVHEMFKNIPGTPQGPRLWHKKVNKELLAIGLRRLADNYSVYVYPGKQMYIVVWVDDIFFFFDTKEMKTATTVWSKLAAALKLPKWQDIGDCLNCTIVRDRPNRVLRLTQASAVKEILKRAGLHKDNVAKADTPIASGFIFTRQDCPAPEDRAATEADAAWYRSFIACLIYLVMWTRPDLAFAQSKLSKFMHCPGPKHVAALKRLLRYLAGTADAHLVYDFSSAPTLKGVYGYYDASHADDVDTMRSTMASIFFFEGCPIYWTSKTNTYVTTSTNHSEYCASARAAKIAVWFHKTFIAMDQRWAVDPISLFSDSQGAIAMNYNPVNRAATWLTTTPESSWPMESSRSLM